jgi:hypothetical protein
MRERADELKGKGQQMFVGGTADMLSLVDTLERLGIDKHFHEEIGVQVTVRKGPMYKYDDRSDYCYYAMVEEKTWYNFSSVDPDSDAFLRRNAAGVVPIVMEFVI